MLVLAIDTATAASSVAVVAVDEAGPDGAVTARARRRHVDARAHGERLAPLIVDALAEAGATVGDLRAVVGGLGPGPFTGLRVGLVTAAAIGHARAVPTFGVCSLDGVGGAVGGAAPVLVATDARRREIYWGVYGHGRRLTGPAVDRPDQVARLLPGHGVTAAYGEGAQRYREQLPVPVADGPVYPDPVVLVEQALDRIRAGADGEVLTPQYLRRPDAADPRPPKPVTVTR